MSVKFTKPNIYFGAVPDGKIVHVYFRIRLNNLDWAIYELKENQ